MDNLKRLLKTEKKHELLLGVLCILYIILQVEPPYFIAVLTNNIYGLTIVLFLSLTLFVSVKPAVAILGCIAAFELIRRSKRVVDYDQSIAKHPYMEDRHEFDSRYTTEYPVTLEEEIIAQRAPLVDTLHPFSKTTFKPMLEETIGTSLINGD